MALSQNNDWSGL